MVWGKMTMNETEEKFKIIITNVDCIKKAMKRLAEITVEAAQILEELSRCTKEEKEDKQ